MIREGATSFPDVRFDAKYADPASAFWLRASRSEVANKPAAALTGAPPDAVLYFRVSESAIVRR